MVGKIVASTGCRKRWVSLRSIQPTAEVYPNGAVENHTIGVNLGKISIFSYDVKRTLRSRNTSCIM